MDYNIKEREYTTQFGDIAYGDGFVYNDIPYMVIPPCKPVWAGFDPEFANAVALRDGSFAFFHDDDKVEMADFFTDVQML